LFGEYSYRSAVLCGRAPYCQARRDDDHGRRRTHATRARRSARDEDRALPHPRLLPADGRGREQRVDAAGDHPGDAPRADVRASGTRHRPRRRGVDGEEEGRGVLLNVSDLISEDILAYLDQHEHKSLLRFITCGSVDDGKSTLIGRLLYESQLLFEDQLAALEVDSRRMGTQG